MIPGGRIYDDTGSFKVEEVWLRDGVVYHVGYYECGEITGAVTMEINMQRRLVHARLHTCGHLIDYALHDIGYTDWKPGKGYHFPDGTYVRYTPAEAIDLSEHSGIAQNIEHALNTRIQSGGAVTTTYVSRDTVADYVTHVPVYIPKDKLCRVVIYDGSGMPCGGTHVRDVREIGLVHIRNVKKKKGDIKIVYKCSA